jgi:hypothetical protein
LRPFRTLGARSGPTNDLGVLWYHLAAREWTTLAVVSPDDNAAASRLARGLVELAGAQYCVLDVRDVSEFRLKVGAATRHEATEGKAAAAGKPWRFLLPIDSVLDNPHAADLLAACDTVVLLLEKERSLLPDALSAVGLVGHERLIGAVLGTH